MASWNSIVLIDILIFLQEACQWLKQIFNLSKSCSFFFKDIQHVISDKGINYKITILKYSIRSQMIGNVTSSYYTAMN